MRRTFAIVIEWETGLEGPADRIPHMLAAVRAQVEQRCDGTAALPETVICFDRAQADEREIRLAMEQATGGLAWPGLLHIVSSPDPLDYYQKKNFGFTFTTNEIVVFLDSDVIPEPDWLATLLAAVEDGSRSVVMGRTHLETRTLYERAVALSWIFDARSEAALFRIHRLNSNNVAFRRALFARMPFPDRPTYRGQCSELGKAIMQAGIALYEEPRARGVHPAHEGVGGFVAKAMHAGRDSGYYDREEHLFSRGRGLAQWRRDLTNVSRRIALRRKVVAASTLDVAAAHLLGFVYYAIKLGAYVTSRAPARTAGGRAA